jgi:hypothetical protein
LEWGETEPLRIVTRLSDDRQGLDWLLGLLYTVTAHDYTSQITITPSLVFSVTLHGNGLQRRTFLSFWVRVLAGWRRSLSPTSYSDRCLQRMLPWAASFRAGLTSNCQTPTSLVILDWLPSRSNTQRKIDSLCSLGADGIENTYFNSASIITCARCLVMTLVLWYLDSRCLAMAVSLSPVF